MANSVVLASAIVKNKIDVSKLGRKVEVAVQQAVYQLGRETRDFARNLAPVRTGGLRASIYVTRPGSEASQLAGKLSKQTSRGYAYAAKRAEALNPKQLQFIGDDPMISVRTQRSLAPKGHFAYMTRKNVTLTHVGINAGMGSETFAGYEDDYRSINEMGATNATTFYTTVGASAFYAVYVEYGTRRFKARPFLAPAVEWARDQLQYRVAAAIASATAKG